MSEAQGAERWRVAVDPTKCRATGVCAASRPDRFRLDRDRSHPVHEEVDPDDELLDVAESCPTEAITVRDAQGKLIAPQL
jgi:ferredoxin